MFDDTHGLIERCIRREEKAWSEFIDRFSGLVYYSAKERLKRSGFCFNDEDVRDIVQNVFIEMWEKSRLAEVRDRQKINAWLSIVGQTRALNFMRNKRERLLAEDESFKLDNMASDGADMDKLEAAEILEEAIESLPAQEKIVLKLSLIHGKKHREIADFMNMPVNTVSTIIARKKELLRRLLNER